MTGLTTACREDARAIADAVGAVVSGLPQGAVIGPEHSAWHTLVSSGFVGVGTPETHGGSGGTLHDLVTVVRALGATGISLPAPELVHLSALMTGESSLPGDVPLVPRVGAELPALDPSGSRVTGVVRGVPHARSVLRFVVVADGPQGPCAVTVEQGNVEPVVNLAGEPRDTVRLDGAPVMGWHGPADVQRLRSRQALLRAAASLGALERIRDLTLRHASDRIQFGKPLAAFQAVQQHLAEIAEEVAAASAAVDVACDAGDAASEAGAWVRVVTAGEAVARLAHQVHGAIGTSQEHPLGHLTTRVWSWSTELGSQRAWRLQVGAAALGTSPVPDLWHAIVPIPATATSPGAS